MGAEAAKARLPARATPAVTPRNVLRFMGYFTAVGVGGRIAGGVSITIGGRSSQVNSGGGRWRERDKGLVFGDQAS